MARHDPNERSNRFLRDHNAHDAGMLATPELLAQYVEMVAAENLKEAARRLAQVTRLTAPRAQARARMLEFNRLRRAAWKEQVRRALENDPWKPRTVLARELGIGRNTVYEIIYQLDRDAPGGARCCETCGQVLPITDGKPPRVR